MIYKVIIEEKLNQGGIIYVVELPENKSVLKIVSVEIRFLGKSTRMWH